MQPANRNRAFGNNDRISNRHTAATASDPQPNPLYTIEATPKDRIQGGSARFSESMAELARNTLKPQNCLVGSDTYETAMSRIIANFKQNYVGAAHGIRNAIRQYAITARESIGPPVELAEATKDSDSCPIPDFIAELLPDSRIKARGGAAAEIRQTILAYEKEVMDGREPPVAPADPVRILWQEALKAGLANVSDNVQVNEQV